MLPRLLTSPCAHVAIGQVKMERFKTRIRFGASTVEVHAHDGAVTRAKVSDVRGKELKLAPHGSQEGFAPQQQHGVKVASDCRLSALATTAASLEAVFDARVADERTRNVEGRNIAASAAQHQRDAMLLCDRKLQ